MRYNKAPIIILQTKSENLVQTGKGKAVPKTGTQIDRDSRVKIRNKVLCTVAIILVAATFVPPAPPAHALIVIRGLQNPTHQISIFVEGGRQFRTR